MKTVKTISILVGTIAAAITAVYYGYCLFAGNQQFPGKPIDSIQKIGAVSGGSMSDLSKDNQQPIDQSNKQSNVVRENTDAPIMPPPRDGIPAGYLRQLEPIQCSDRYHDANDITCRGVKYYNSFRVDFGSTSRQYIMEYNIGGDKQELNYGFGYDDTHPTYPDDDVFAVLEVLGDGVLLTDPITVRPNDPPVLREANVQGVFKLTFIVSNDGSDRASDPCILDPKVT